MSVLRIGIVGANGRVGTDICTHFKGRDDIELIPIVRNILGAAYLEDRGFHCRIADVGEYQEARQAISDLDCVVVASHVFAAGPGAMAANRRIVCNAVRAAKPAAVVIYFSSVRALAWRVDRATKRFAIPKNYDRSKRRLERILWHEGKRAGKKTIALRLGHVLGPNQTREQLFVDTCKQFSTVRLPTESTDVSNVVHTVTIADCIETCATGDVDAGLYSLANQPQWSWEQVFDYYNTADATLVFEPKPPSNFGWQALLGPIFRYMLRNREWLGECRQFLPRGLEERMQRRLSVARVRADLADLEDLDVKILSRHEFNYRPMPGPFVQGLQDTRALLGKSCPTRSEK